MSNNQISKLFGASFLAVGLSISRISYSAMAKDSQTTETVSAV